MMHGPAREAAARIAKQLPTTRILDTIGLADGFDAADLECEAKHIYPIGDFLTALSLVGAEVVIALVTEAVRSVTMANVVYRGIADYERVIEVVLAYRTRESAPAVLAFIETCKGLRA